MRKARTLPTWYLASQFASSGSNFLLTAWMARTLSSDEFGAFSVAIAVYLVFVGSLRSLLLVPHLSSKMEGGLHARPMTAAAIGLGIVVAIALLVPASLAPGPIATNLLAVAAILPATAWHDAVRHVAFANGSPRGAAVADLRWLGTFALVGTAASAFASPSGAQALTIWGLASLAGSIGTPVGTEVRAAVSRLGAASGPGSSFLTEFLLRSGSLQLAIVLIGAFGSLSATGALRAALTAIAPIGLVAAGLTPMLTRSAHNPRPSRLQSDLRRGAVLFGAVAVYTAVALALPHALWERVFGQTSTGAITAFGGIALMIAAEAFAAPAAATLRGTHFGRPLVLIRILYAVVLLAAATRWASMGPSFAWIVGSAECFAAALTVAALRTIK